jgi:hypothetical protein
MSRCWLALVEGPAKGADAAAPAIAPDGHPAGTLAAWRRRAKPVREALRVDERLIDPDGSTAWISLVLPPSGVRLPFDDPAVQQARRQVLLHPFPAAGDRALEVRVVAEQRRPLRLIPPSASFMPIQKNAAPHSSSTRASGRATTSR